MTKFKTFEEYFATVPEIAKAPLLEVRAAIKEAAPEAEEGISYNMPAFKLHGNLVFYAAFKEHIGFYPLPSGIKSHPELLEGYKYAKGSIQFPLDRPMPLELIRTIVRSRVAENLSKIK